MRLSTTYDRGRPVISFEVFPPKTDEGLENLMVELAKLKQFHPAFISVTYGAGGSNQARSIQVIERVQKLGLIPLPHFTCVGSDKEFILAFTKQIEAMGIHNIVALRGDPPKDRTNYRPEHNVFAYASELVEFLRKNTTLEIAVAGYPEVHPAAESAGKDLDALVKKVNAGASVIITQLFYDNQVYYELVRNLRDRGVTVPVVPGVLPLIAQSQIDRVQALSGTKFPKVFLNELEACGTNVEAFRKAGIRFAIAQIKDLLANGAPGIHLYPFNQAAAVTEVLSALSL